MIKGRSPCWALLFAAALVFSLAVDGKAAEQSKQTAKPSKSAQKHTKTAPPAVQMGLEPKAMEVIKAACDRLAAARTMRFTAVVTYEHPSRIGPPLAYTTKSEVTMERPDKLRVITPADGPASEFYYDGKTMAAYAAAEKLVAVADAPPTIDGMLEAAYDIADIYYPFADLIVSDPFKDLSEGLRIAFYIGQSKVVGGVTTDMVAYVNDNVFVQAWIGVEDKLPRMLRAEYRGDPARLRHQMELSNWQLDLAAPSDAFTLENIGSLTRIPFARPDVPPPGLKPPAKPKAKTKATPKAKPTGK
jgi:hypothetical protein